MLTVKPGIEWHWMIVVPMVLGGLMWAAGILGVCWIAFD